MRIQDIKVGEYYRLTSTKGLNRYYGWVKAIEVYRRGEYGNPDPEKKSIVKCEHLGFIRYFRPNELVKED